MTTYGFVHTSAVHVPVFEALVAELAPDARIVTVVDENALSTARRLSPEHPEVVGAIEVAIVDLVERGAGAIVCTCSTVGDTAEIVGGRLGVDVARVDRAMAEQAVAGGGKVLVLAALESTLAPTTRLLESTAASVGTRPTITTRLVEGAWSRFEAGDVEGYCARVAEVIEFAAADVGGGPDVIVLAQASMAPAADLVGSSGPRVLSSPRLAVERLVG